MPSCRSGSREAPAIPSLGDRDSGWLIEGCLQLDDREIDDVAGLCLGPAATADEGPSVSHPTSVL